MRKGVEMEKSLRRTGILGATSVCLLAVLLVLAGCGWDLQRGGMTSTPGITKGVFPPDSKPAGKSYGEWSAAWWQWYIAIPASKHPYYNDQTGVNAGVNQSGPVWFLVGSPVSPCERTSAIPADRLILFPIINTSFMFTSPTDTMAAARAANKDGLKHVMYMEASVDGVALANLGSFRFESSLFETIQDPIDPLWPFLPPGPYPTVAEGYWIMLEPLPPGQHTIHFRADTAWEEPTGGVKRNVSSVTYHITVQ